jgi:hypothetical protein
MHYQFMLRSAAETPEHDYSQTAIAELDIKADAMAIVRPPLPHPKSQSQFQLHGREWKGKSC